MFGLQPVEVGDPAPDPPVRWLVERLPSRHPSNELLLQALESTLCASGRINKTRAALFLGWDPATLQSRLRERGVGGARTLLEVRSGIRRRG